VIGLGQFGRAVAVDLVRQGGAVLAVDLNPERAKLIEASVDAVVIADATDEAALAELGMERMSCVVVAMGLRSKDTSIMVTALLRQRGIRRVVSRATSELHGRVLLAVGAHEIVNPEASMGARTAHHLANPHVVDQFAFGAETIVAHVEAPEVYVNKSLQELQRAGIEVLALRRGSKRIINLPADERLASGDALLVTGSVAAVRQFAARA
jgi:trk system potassium uptake protein TrkA